MQVNSLSKIKNLLGSSGGFGQTFNANLPISIQVLQKTDYVRYLIKLGSKTLTTKSNKNLKIGANYWANLSENKKAGNLNISKMLKKPSFLEYLQQFSLEFNAFEKLFCFDDFSELYKNYLLENLANSSTKQEFMFHSNNLLAYKENVYNLPLKLDTQYIFFQFKILDNQKIQFYCALDNLGPINGRISFLEDEISSLDIFVYYEKSLFYLQKYKDELGLEVNISLFENVKPLYELNDYLLDLKG